ncbi:MAG TPA: FkbM family methyltransferase [Xanthobacteraceae bacterium]
MDLSYAANLEDYHLARAFEGQASGFYIDVGAGHPVADNVSCWFYLRGWRGLVVEPQRRLVELYPLVRPRDIAVPKLLGRAAGEVDFHVVERLNGFSSIFPEHARNARKFGAGFHTCRMPMTTLSAICEEHGVGPIDFLKIDVEGAEGDVLAGGDFRRFRPRVVLLEALAPGTMAENFAEWEPFLLDQGYVFVLFDGLNRFYVAREDAALIARFPKEAAPWLVVPHLGHTNRAPDRTDHPDHAFARALVAGFLARLPRLDSELLLAFILDESQTELRREPDASDRAAAIARLFPVDKHPDGVPGPTGIDAANVRELYAKLMETDQFRIMLGRIAASYDGGQILD